MKVAYLVNRYPKASHSFIRREIRALEELGFEVVRVSIRAPGRDLVDPRDREEARRTVVLLADPAGLLARAAGFVLRSPGKALAGLGAALREGWRSDRGVFRHLAYWVEAVALVDLARRKGFRHVHAHFGTNPPAVCVLARRMGGISFSFTVHGPEEFDRPLPLKLGRKVSQADFVVAVSEFGRSQLFRWSDRDSWRKIHVVHCGVDELWLAADPEPVPDVRRIVCVGRLCEQKGQLLLVDAVERLVRGGADDFECVLAGDGEMRAEVERRIRERGLSDRMRITGWLDNDAVRREILNARALVLPSFAEGLPVVLMEALAAGRPVVTTYVAGIPELVVPGECGWLVPAGDVAALTCALAEVLDTPVEELTRMGRNGAMRVRAHHDARREAAKLARHLERVA